MALIAVYLVITVSPLYAQQSSHFDNGLSFNLSAHSGGIVFGSEGSNLNDYYKNEPGFGLQLQYGYSLTPMISVKSGIGFSMLRYSFSSEQQGTDETGNPTGEIIISESDGVMSNTYIDVPLNFVLRPLPNRAFYVMAGPQLSFKVGYTNRDFIARHISADGDVLFVFDPVTYDTPERSNNILLLAKAGIGYSLDTMNFPLNFELGFGHSLTPYLGGDGFINNYTRTFSFTIAYRF
ncbi:MAG: PorT family protein [Balneolales bacterium]|nr:PorT family protein [Balneolales bacterium]